FSPLFFISLPRTPSSTLFPYTTLFRSAGAARPLQLPPRQLSAPRASREGRRLWRLRASGSCQRHVLSRLLSRREHRAHVRGLRRSEEHTSELQSRENLVCRLLLEKKKQ